jgi:hypothetical protein
MPLSAPAVERELLHTRRVTCQGFRRADGLWDIEGHITDTKTHPMGPSSGLDKTVPAGEFLHEMWIRLTIDDTMRVVAVEAVTDNSPHAQCPAITAAFQKLVGLRIAGGWTAAVKERVGGVQGCTHLVELLGPVATTAFQTLTAVLWKRAEEAVGRGERDSRGGMVNTCHAWSADGDLVRRHFPAHYTGSGE